MIFQTDSSKIEVAFQSVVVYDIELLYYCYISLKAQFRFVLWAVKPGLALIDRSNVRSASRYITFRFHFWNAKEVKRTWSHSSSFQRIALSLPGWPSKIYRRVIEWNFSHSPRIFSNRCQEKVRSHRIYANFCEIRRFFAVSCPDCGKIRPSRLPAANSEKTYYGP